MADPERPPPGTSWLLVAVLVGLALLAATRGWWSPAPPQGVLVDVRGDVSRPGLVMAQAASVTAAIRAAGGDITGMSDRPIAEGDVVVVGPHGVEVRSPSDPEIVGRRVDLNGADAAALDTLPGIGPVLAARIVDEREAGGPFRDVDDLADRVVGVGPATAGELAERVDVR